VGNLPHFEPPGDVAFVAPFWEGVEREELLLPKCSVCGSWQWYPDDSGTCCVNGTLVWKQVSGIGTVHTTTTIRRPFLPGGANDVPFAVVFVELDDAPGVRFVGNAADDATEIGARVGVQFVPLGVRRHPVFHRIERVSVNPH
jgi:uncharacterized protein